MEANTRQTSTDRPIRSTDNAQGICRIVASPRCTALFSDGNHCKLPACRLDKTSKVAKYTEHCYRHGGKQELDSYRRANAQSIMSSTVENTTSELHRQLGTDLAPADGDTSSSTLPDLHGDQNPKATGAEVPQDTTSTDRPISGVGGGTEKVEPKKLQVQVSGEVEPLYSVGDPTLRKSFQHKLNHGKMNLNEELAIIRTLIQDIFKRLQSGTNSADELRQLVKLLPLADKIINTIHKVEDTRKVQYTRESLRIDVMRIVSEIRKNLPDGTLQLRGEEIRRNIAVGLAKTLGPSLAESGEIVMTREVFKRG